MLTTRSTEWVGCSIPIQQAGMGSAVDLLGETGNSFTGLARYGLARFHRAIAAQQC